METWKFVLLGITGDLAKLKILPALSQFADQNQEKVSIDLIGFSRSQPDTEALEKLLNNHAREDKHKLHSIKYVQGEYTNPQHFNQIMSQKAPEDRVIVYLAVPPTVFPEFMNGACAYHNERLDILMEKPFGSDIQEAQRILQSIHSCHLESNVHFLDHYLFKSSSLLTKVETQNFKEIKSKNIVAMSLKALEDISVKDRVSYYNQIGALKDMFVHMFSLFQLGLRVTGREEDNDFAQLSVESIQVGQYRSYKKDTQLKDTQTDTYFYAGLRSKSGVPIAMESGKKLKEKSTSIQIVFDDGSELNWNLDPDKRISLKSTEQELDMSLDRNNKRDHTNLFEALLSGNTRTFVDTTDVLRGWRLYTELEELRRFKVGPNTPLYKDGKYPVQFID
jgi:glucose-6-phosphate 1-dehydrogenase